MSEAMTNREIEDVLTSIRRLVAQDTARPVDRLADGAGDDGRLILTESQRVDATPDAHATVEPEAPGPREMPAPDFGRLEATIAELEAAVTASGGAWDGETADPAPHPSNVTELYTRVAFTHRMASEVDAEATSAAADQGIVGPEDVAAGQGPEIASDAAGEARDSVVSADASESLQDDDDSDEILDEAGLHALIAQIVREELQGQLGERITAQVRKLVRAEISKALDERRMV